MEIKYIITQKELDYISKFIDECCLSFELDGKRTKKEINEWREDIISIILQLLRYSKIIN